MKKKLFLPALAMLFAAGGAFASVNLADRFYGVNDYDCTGVTITQPCPVGSLFNCEDGNKDQYHYIPNDGTDCLPLMTNIPN